MNKTLYRISLTLLAFSLGIGMVVAITFAGEKTSGPLEDFFSAVGNSVVSIEHDIISSTQEVKRSDQLHWFQAYRNSLKKLNHPDVILLGAYDNRQSDSYEPIVSLEDTFNTKFPIIQIYTAWGSKKEQKFPFTQVKAIYDLGSIPLITWEPWLADFDKSEFPTKGDNENRDWGGLKAIAAGEYDAYIDEWAGRAKSYGATFFLRLGHEMNDPYRYPWGPQNNKPEEFIAAWKHVHDRFIADGVKNVSWIWSPHPAYKLYKEYYPGDAYVDWVGVPALNYGTVANWSNWYSFDEIFGTYYDSLSVFKKPVMITEFASLSVGGERAGWYKEALTNLPEKFPTVKAVVFYHSANDNTTTYKSLDWTVTRDRKSVDEIVKGLASWKIPNIP